MARIPPPVAAVRLAVRRSLAALPPGTTTLVACSGGADSMALAAATAFVAPGAGLITVDHGLQPGSAQRAAEVVRWARSAGFGTAEAVRVEVTGPGGPEAAARDARYAAISSFAERFAQVVVLLGHTRDDQAETVLLALARGAGPRGLSGMPARRGLLLRPLLDVSRADTRKACAALGLPVWDDPHNTDPAYARARVRSDALPALVAALGPRVVDNLARTAAQLGADNAALDRLAVAALGDARTGEGLGVSGLAGLDPAVRTRVLHAWARELGAPGAALSHRHVTAMDDLVTDWHGQGAVALPGGIGVTRRAGDLIRIEL